MSNVEIQHLRQEIDAIDDSVHDLLMKRVALVERLGREKKKQGGPVIQPAREATILKRLLGRHQGALQPQAVVRIWREIIGAVSEIQARSLKVAVTVPDNEPARLACLELAKDYFSSVIPVKKASSPLQALAMVREEEASFAVLPWPEDGMAKPWWRVLQDESAEGGMHIFARLPYGDADNESARMEPKALAVAKVAFQPSGDDRSFIVLELEEDISRGRLVDKAKAAGLTPLGICNASGVPGQMNAYLVEVEDYVARGDARLKKLIEAVGDPAGRAHCLGGYPVPPVYADEE